MFLYNVGTQELFQGRKIWDRVCLKNIQSLSYSIMFFNIFYLAKGGTNNRKFLENIFTQKLL